MSLTIPTPLSFSKTLTSQDPCFLSKFSHLSISAPPLRRRATVIRMGGGPRTYPGGVSKWQWKRMQAKKAKQLLKARLARERQVYEMRKRAELKAAVSELERPWEVVQRAPNLFSVKADEQVKVLADRFQKPGGFDMWSERDGPQLFQTPDGFPSARFFPKGVVHSIRPYGIASESSDSGDGDLDSDLDSEIESENEIGVRLDRRTDKDGNKRNGVRVNGRLGERNDEDLLGMEAHSESESQFGGNSSREWDRETKNSDRNNGKFGRQGKRNRLRSDTGSLNSEQVGMGRRQRGDSDSDRKPNRSKSEYRTGWRSGNDNKTRNSRYSNSEVYDMDLQQDGSYGFQGKTRQLRSQSAGN